MNFFSMENIGPASGEKKTCIDIYALQRKKLVERVLINVDCIKWQ